MQIMGSKMIEDDLNIRIDLLFEREKIILKKGKLPWFVDINDEFKYEHSEILIELYIGTNEPEIRKVLIERLMNEVVSGEEIVLLNVFDGFDVYDEIKTFVSCTALAFFTLIRLGFIDETINRLKSRSLNNEFEETLTSLSIVSLLISLFKSSMRIFSFNQIMELITIIKNEPNKLYQYNCKVFDEAQEIITDNGLEVIKSELEGTNIEINRDKKAVIDRINYLMFDEKYKYFLEEIDKYINTNSSIVSSGMVGNMRSFMEGILIDIAKKISQKIKEEIPIDNKLGYMGNIRRYLKKKLELTDADNQLIDKYISVLHSEGGHSFISSIEYFRLAKNIGVEIILLVMKKYEQVLE